MIQSDKMDRDSDRSYNMLRVLLLLGVVAPLATDAFKFVPLQGELVYEYVGTVRVGAQAPMETEELTPPAVSGWKIRGTLKLQRHDNRTLAAAMAVEKIILHGSERAFYQNKEMLPVYNPFRIVTDADDMVERLAFKRRDPLWSRNFKRSIAAAIQVQGTRAGTFVTPEPTLHGRCATEYYIAANVPNRTFTVKKTTELNSCQLYAGGIHYERSNVPVNPCEFDYQKNVIVGNEAIYEIDDMRAPAGDNSTADEAPADYRLRSVNVTGLTMVQTFESTGEAQYISSELQLSFVSETPAIVNPLDVHTEMTDSPDATEDAGAATAATEVRGPSTMRAPEPLPGVDLAMATLGRDVTGGRQTETAEKLIKDAIALFGALCDSLERSDLDFDEPYDNRVAEIIQVLGQMDGALLRRLYAEFDIGTSYRQETIRNLFYEIVPRIGTAAAVLLTRDVILEAKVRPWTAVQLLISLPFHILELSQELVTECEKLLDISQNRPDVQEAAVLSFSTLVYHAFNRSRIDESSFERYVLMYLDLYMRGNDYEHRMIYLQGLGNMLIGKVGDYIDPIIRDESIDTDTRFLAILATMPLARSRPEQVYETYWPLFNNRNSTLELRVLAFSALLLSNPSPARLMSLHSVLRHEENPHMKNFYRTTILSMSGTTHPCYQELKRLLSYMSRHIPQSDAAKYWATGQYLYDYRDQQYGIGAMLQNTLIADEQTSIPYIGIFEFHTEALGKFSSQLTLIIKARGLFGSVANTVDFTEPSSLFPAIAEALGRLQMPSVKRKPFHLEVLIKSEGKFVISFFINQKTIKELSKDMFQRIIDNLLADSHINMQTIRWPFMLKYSVPTVLGTPAQVTIQSTVLASWRGNLTNHKTADLFARSHDLDFRYSAYAVCKSTTYNPFLNLEHTVNREQGFLVYLPVHNNISSVTDGPYRFSLMRPANVTSAGASLKSRSLTSTKGTILPTDKTMFSEVVISSRQLPMTHFQHELRDLGLNFTAGSTIMDLTNHLAFLVQSDIKENTKVLLGGNSVIDVFIMFAGILQLNAMHIGNNKNFAFLVHNDERIQMDSSLTWLNSQTVQLNVRHSAEDRTLLNWTLTVDAQNYTEVGFSLWGERFDERRRKLQTLAEGRFEYIILAKRPYGLKGSVEFDSVTDGVDGSLLRSHIDVVATAGMSEHSIGIYEAEPLIDGQCPREMLRFNPPPMVYRCPPSVFANISMLSKYTLDVHLSNMPPWYHEYADRFEHIVSTFASYPRVPLNFSAELSGRLDVRPDDLTMQVSLNRQKFTVPNVPRYFKQLRDVKFDALPFYGIDYGLTTMCSVVGDRLYSFNDHHVDLGNAMLPNNASVLLLADCSTSSHFALTVRRLSNGLYALRLRHKYADVEYVPQTEQLAAVVSVNGRQWPLQQSGNGTLSELIESSGSPVDIYVNDEGLLVLVVYYEYMVQFDMRTIFTVQQINVNKERLCGLCNAPLNELPSYVVEDVRTSGGDVAAAVTTD